MSLLSLSRMFCHNCNRVTWHKRNLWRRSYYRCRVCGIERPFKVSKKFDYERTGSGDVELI